MHINKIATQSTGFVVSYPECFISFLRSHNRTMSEKSAESVLDLLHRHNVSTVDWVPELAAVFQVRPHVRLEHICQELRVPGNETSTDNTDFS